jgi:thiamine-phosphate pyrophosphorylase
VFPRLQFLTLDASPLTHRAQALAALEGGVRWIQLRAKHLREDVWVAEAAAIAELCRDYGATFIVNDSPQVALRAEADGVHLGGDDVSPDAARALLGDFAIVGVTLNEPAHLARFAGVRVDYVGVGPFRHTASKQKLAAIHTAESLAALIAAAAPLPCYAIGGVTATDWPELRSLRAHGIAVSGAIAMASDPISAAKSLVEAVSA